MDESVYTVKTQKFEGPLDLLLSLIEKKKLHISDVSLAGVTDDYISYIQGNAHKDLPNITLFLSVAATLVLIKSKMLLDGNITDEELQHAEHNLEERLRLLESLRRGAVLYVKSMPSPYVQFSRRRPLSSVSFVPHESVHPQNLHDIALSMTQNLPEEKEELHKVSILRVMTLEEMIGKITASLSMVRGRTSFSSLAKSAEFSDMTPKEKKVSVIISFLAVLELVRSGLMDAEQENTYGDILVEPAPVETQN